MARATVFHDDPAAQAAAFQNQGFEYLHIVDLDGAIAGKPVNTAAVARIRAAVGVPIQLGGGIRDSATLEAWLGKGIDRVIIGTAAVRNPTFVKNATRGLSRPHRLGLDAREGRVAVKGGQHDGSRRHRPREAFRRCRMAATIQHPTSRDGLLKGLNLEATLALAEAFNTRDRIRWIGLDRRHQGAAPPARESSPARSRDARSTTDGSTR